MKLEDGKEGMRVLATGHCIHGAGCHSFNAKEGTIINAKYQCDNGMTVADVAWTGEMSSNANLIEYCFLEPVCPEKASHQKIACILTEKVWVDGTKCRKIIGFEGILPRHKLPHEYLESSPRFLAGSRWLTCWYPKAGDRHYVVSVPVGHTMQEDDFKELMIWLGRAGERLASIRKKEAWGGEEIIEI